MFLFQFPQLFFKVIANIQSVFHQLENRTINSFKKKTLYLNKYQTLTATFSSSMTSMTALAIAQLTGLPPNVLKYSRPVA